MLQLNEMFFFIFVPQKDLFMKHMLRKALLILPLMLASCPLIKADSVAIGQTGKTFEQLLTENEYIVIKFWMPNCGPCKNLAPRFEEVSKNFDNVLFLTINIREHRSIASRYNIRSVPKIFYIENGNVVATQSGGQVSTAAIKNNIHSLFGV